MKDVIKPDGELTFRRALRFPVQSPEARREILIGGLLLLIPAWGWIANLGHRVVYTHNMLNGRDPFPAWKSYGEITRHGLITLAGMVYYHLPGALALAAGWYFDLAALNVVGSVLWLLGTLLVPGYMTRYCRNYDARLIWNVRETVRTVVRGGAAYWKAWAVVAAAMALSFLGLLALGIGFLFTSVWFWQTAAFSFASVFAREAST